MSGALAERVFAHKIERVGFIEIRVVERAPFGVDDAVGYPLFTPDLIDLMRRLIPDEQQTSIATSITLIARKP